MKKVLVLLTLVATVTAYSQGTVSFQNRNTAIVPNIDAPISYAAGGPAAAGNVNGLTSVDLGAFRYGGVNAMAGLYGGAAGTAEDALVLLVPAVGFRTTTATAGYINVGSATSRTVDGVAPGAQGVFQVRAWDAGIAAASYEAAAALISAQQGVYLGKSALLTLTLGGAGSPPGPAAPLTGLAPFSMTYNIVPEPSIIGLGILGAIAGLMVFRRRS